jgi:hypothetical protein
MEMMCYCPTIARATELVGIYERLIEDIFWTVGWPGFRTKGPWKEKDEDDT